jgi:hypothetical protein
MRAFDATTGRLLVDDSLVRFTTAVARNLAHVIYTFGSSGLGISLLTLAATRLRDLLKRDSSCLRPHEPLRSAWLRRLRYWALIFVYGGILGCGLHLLLRPLTSTLDLTRQHIVVLSNASSANTS